MPAWITSLLREEVSEPISSCCSSTITSWPAIGQRPGDGQAHRAGADDDGFDVRGHGLLPCACGVGSSERNLRRMIDRKTQYCARKATTLAPTAPKVMNQAHAWKLMVVATNKVQGAEQEHQRRPGVAGSHHDAQRKIVARDGRQVAGHPAVAEHDRADGPVNDGRLHHDEAAVLGDEGRGAEHEHQAERQPLHGIDRAARELHHGELRDSHGNGEAGRQRDAVAQDVDREEYDRRQEVREQLLQGGAHACSLSGWRWLVRFMPLRAGIIQPRPGREYLAHGT